MCRVERHRVHTGLEILLEERMDSLRGKRVGLLANPSSVHVNLGHASDLLRASGADLRVLFGPEHGIRGEAQDMIGVESGVDPRLGLPVFSLYGQTSEALRPRRDSLEDLDVLIVDLQDIGSRYYTYCWTMILCVSACAEAGVSVIILDRPNPLDGMTLEGPGIEEGFTSFVGMYSVPVRHGLTIGELARLWSTERNVALDLEVIPMRGWRRRMFFDELNLPWVLPSPNMPTLDTALVYPGTCLLEGTNLSEGRGTTRPFEILGAPWVDGWELTAALEREDLPGVKFRPLSFRPCFHKHAQKVCGGVQIHIMDRQRFASFRTGVALLLHLHRLWPGEFQWRKEAYEFVTNRPAIDLLAGGTWLRQGIEKGADLPSLISFWRSAEYAFSERRRPHLLYPE
jgi:uncharacterized protein YbbC (DUF1343 family)